MTWGVGALCTFDGPSRTFVLIERQIMMAGLMAAERGIFLCVCVSVCVSSCKLCLRFRIFFLFGFVEVWRLCLIMRLDDFVWLFFLCLVYLVFQFKLF